MAIKLKSIKYYTKGKRSLVYTALYNKKKVAIKKSKNKLFIQNIKNEAKFLKILNKYDIGPKLLDIKKDGIVYEFIEGIPLVEWVSQNKKTEIKKVLILILKKCFILDKLKINKKEFHRPLKHILIYKNKPKMIDFERCYFAEKPKNVTQFCQFLISIRNILNKKGFEIDKNTMIKHLRIYKINQNNKNFKKILDLLK